MKKILSYILTIALLISLLSGVGVSAATTGYKMTVGNTSGAAGKSVTVEVVLENNPGISSAILEIDYDQTRLTLDAATIGTAFSSGAFTNINLPYITFVRSGDVTEDDVLLTLAFTIKDDAAMGDAYVTVLYEEGDITNYDEEDVNFEVIPGKIVVKCAHANTANVPEEPADCDEGGYTAGVYCNDCETYISGHEPTPATGNHTDADDKWESDEVNHFRTCDCGHIFDTAAHSGGTATCKEKAKCSTCGAEYGQLNAANHTGGTTVVNSSEPNHKTQQAGYTGDTKCLGCGEIINYGQPIAPDAHTPANVWAKDETHHWKECNVVGCGVVIDGSKAHHASDKAENKATCQKKAVCDVCGVSYGSVADHDYSAADKKQGALKAEGNCRDNAVFYYSCSVCGLVENNDSHTFLGDKVATAHVGSTTIVNASQADHKAQIDGYTGDTKCLGCGEITAYGQTIPAGAHIPATTWTTDGTHHWKVCTVENCGVIIDISKTVHTATGTNVATCKTQAICDVCDTAHGSLNASNHAGGTTIVNAYEPDHKTQTAGYTGDTKCLGCGEILSYGEPIPAGAHTPANVWSNNDEYHWKECTVVGCGIVIDGSKAKHTSTGSNVATCQKKAVCDVCGVSYGTVADHDWNTNSWEKDASGHWHKCNTAGCTEKNAFGGHTPDHQGGATEEYAIKCSICQFEIEAQLGHTHVFDKEIVAEQYLASKADCTEPAKYYKSCKCGEKGSETFASGEALGHTEGTEWKSDADNHWHKCSVAGCGVIIDNSKAAHTPDRDAATETDPIKCSVCGYEITPALGHTHAHSTEWKSDNDSHWNECACGDKANTVAHSDTNNDGKCDTCGYNVGLPADPSNPQTGDNSMIALWIILLCVSALGIVATTVLNKKKSFR